MHLEAVIRALANSPIERSSPEQTLYDSPETPLAIIDRYARTTSRTSVKSRLVSSLPTGMLFLPSFFACKILSAKAAVTKFMF